MKDVVLKPGQEMNITIPYPKYTYQCSGTEKYTRKHTGGDEFFFRNEDPENDLIISFPLTKH